MSSLSIEWVNRLNKLVGHFKEARRLLAVCPLLGSDRHVKVQWSVHEKAMKKYLVQWVFRGYSHEIDQTHTEKYMARRNKEYVGECK